MHSVFESWDGGSLKLCTHPAYFQGTSESEEWWESWLCLGDRWICEGGEVALLEKWSELFVCRYYLVQSLVSACTESCHINFICCIPNPVNFYQNDLCSFLFSLFLSCAVVFKLNKHWSLILDVLQLHHSLHAKCTNLSLFEVLCWVCCMDVCSPISETFRYLNIKCERKIIETSVIRGWMQYTL